MPTGAGSPSLTPHPLPPARPQTCDPSFGKGTERAAVGRREHAAPQRVWGHWGRRGDPSPIAGVWQDAEGGSVPASW